MNGILDNILTGFAVALEPQNLMMAFIGTSLGTLIGVLPGLGPLATMAMLLPLTFHVAPEAALIMLAGIYYGAQYGCSTTSILINLPGESSSAVTCLDGHQLARQGRGGVALAIAAIASFCGGTVATIVTILFAVPLSALGLAFGAADYFSLMVFGLVGSILLARGSLLKAVGMILFGVLLGLIGTDVNSGDQRFTFGFDELFEGIDFTCVAIGIFGLAEIIKNLATGAGQQPLPISPIAENYPKKEDFRAAWPAMLRGSFVGSFLGLLPGGGALLSSFAAYGLEKKISKTPDRFGKGAIEGVAGPESANNAGAQTSFIPMLTLGLPSNPTMAIMIGALMIQGITPGPQVMVAQPALVWGLIISMWVGNIMLLFINLPLIGMWVSVLRIPYRILFPCIILFCAIGVYSIRGSAFDIYAAAAMGLLGYVLLRVNCEPAPLALGMILGPMIEENFRRAMQLSSGNPLTFFSHPISLGFLIAAAILVAVVALPMIRRERNVIFEES
ncbi:tripartite tricarboxylate transporter permease [Rhizobium leguminosarum]|uniref:tripartite tricarboxylate transporter permease n=1 Tax=Rhizobium leguminosarum TaxID=384 RepID=UPI003F972F3F